jgi:hypothetical protein
LSARIGVDRDRPIGLEHEQPQGFR